MTTEYMLYNTVSHETVTLCDYDDAACIAALQEEGFYMLSPETYGDDAYAYPAIYKSPGIVWDQSQERRTNGDWTMYSTSGVDSDLNEDGFVDEVTNYQMWTASGGVDLTNPGGRTYSDNTSRQWDLTKAVEVPAGFSILLEGDRKKAGSYRVVSARENGVLSGASSWMNEFQLFRRGYEEVFEMDFNDNGVIDFV